jgi:hypothetical protein
VRDSGELDPKADSGSHRSAGGLDGEGAAMSAIDELRKLPLPDALCELDRIAVQNSQGAEDLRRQLLAVDADDPRIDLCPLPDTASWLAALVAKPERPRSIEERMTKIEERLTALEEELDRG